MESERPLPSTLDFARLTVLLERSFRVCDDYLNFSCYAS